MTRTDADPKALPEETCNQVIAQVKAYLDEKGIRQHQLARALAVSTTTVNQVLKGKYAGNAKQLILDMDRWLERRREADGQPKVADFVWTQVAREIRVAARRAIASADMGLDSRISLVWGDPGCGKTLALQAIADTENGILVEMDFHSASPIGVLEKIATAIRMPISRSSRILFDNLVQKLAGSGKLIIVDEIHALLLGRDDKAFHTLRRLADQTKCPMLWSATSDLMTELRKRERKREPLAQISSRILMQAHLTGKLSRNGTGGEPLYTVDEIIRIYARNEMRLSRDAGNYLARLCSSPYLGLLRTCTKIVGQAVFLYRSESDVLTAEMLWKTHQLLCQDSEIEAVRAVVTVDDLMRPAMKVG